MNRNQFDDFWNVAPYLLMAAIVLWLFGAGGLQKVQSDSAPTEQLPYYTEV